jgi:hypothetical protein
MTPLAFLLQQVDNVEQALAETLRYDYGPKRISDYYQECCERLERIKSGVQGTAESELPEIKARLGELSNLSIWISLIERARLGEFSWPFAESLRAIADVLLSEPGLTADTSPIVHVIAEGEGYYIYSEGISASARHQFLVIAFPRPLKHYVLLHSIFGHELGHSALHMASPTNILQSEVMPAIQASGPLAGVGAVTLWLHGAAAPEEVMRELREYETQNGRAYEFSEDHLLSWVDELICDLFGLLLFGPSFAAAHRTLLRPMNPNPYEIGLTYPTHPPYAVRQKLLARATHLIGWDQPITQNYQAVEQSLINFIVDDSYSSWASILSDEQLKEAIRGIRKVLDSRGSFSYVQPEGKALETLLEQLFSRLPPIMARLSEDGAADLSKVNFTHTLYGGWVYALGGTSSGAAPLSFLDVNKLCDQALLQQRAIDIAIDPGIK